MGGGLMQLVAYGAQDIYLTGNPQITFFKVVYRRHTNFAMETVEQTLSGTTTLTTATEHFDGTSWTSGGSMNTGRTNHGGSSTGSQTSSLMFRVVDIASLRFFDQIL